MPYLNTIAFWASIITAFLLSMVGWWVMTRALFPNFASRAERKWTGRPVLSFFIGAVAIVMVVFVVSILGGPGVFVIAAALGVSLSGASGLAGRIGAGMASPTDEGRNWFRTLKGSIVLALSMLVPVLGWFLVLPITLAGGIGAAFLALIGGNEQDATAQPEVHDEPGWEIAKPPVSGGVAWGVNG